MHRKGKRRSGQISEVVAHRLELLVAHLVLAALAALPCVPDDGACILVVHVAAAHADRKRWQLFDKVDALQETFLTSREDSSTVWRARTLAAVEMKGTLKQTGNGTSRRTR